MPQFEMMDILKYTGLVLFFAVVIYLLVNYIRKNQHMESFDNEENKNEIPQPSESLGEDNYKSLTTSDSLKDNQLPNDCYPKDQLSPSDLLPTDSNSLWAQVNPVGQGELKDKNFLEAGYHIGINTVGQTLRNPNYQLRSEPPNPQVKVSPWLQSTIEPDSNRRPMEIGA
jgi:hypothetical protein